MKRTSYSFGTNNYAINQAPVYRVFQDKFYCINHSNYLHMILRIFLTGLLYLTIAFNGFSQKTQIYTQSDAEFRRGIDLFQKQKYGAAQRCFEGIINTGSLSDESIIGDARYYAAICAIELFNEDAGSLMDQFIKLNPENHRIEYASFQMGRFEYNRKKYPDAIKWFQKVDKYSLSGDDFSEYCFESGYCYFMTNDFDKARSAFTEIKDIDTKYTIPAIYYYSHIAYTQKNYETALQGFQRLSNDETFGSIVPYYISQIYYLKKDYDKVIDYAPGLLDSINENRVAEMSRIIGDAYYRKGKYKEAVPYLEKYEKKAKTLSPADKYELAFVYYKTGKYADAAKFFEQAVNGEDTLAQNASYHLGDCYIKLNEKNKARMAFSSASRMDFDKVIKEDAMFNYALVTYELSYSPFNEALNAFIEYLKTYPNSARSDEANNYLVQAYIGTKNYKEALVSLDKIRTMDSRTKKAYQHVAFFRGLELYNNLAFEDAGKMFDKSLKYREYDKNIAARSYYWKGETEYRLKRYDEAIDNYNKFLETPGVIETEEFKLAGYGLGYAYFNKKNYVSASSWFRKYDATMKGSKTKLVADAYNRIGDCYFMAPAYWEAINYYEKSITLNTSDPDYAMFQKGFSLGLVDRHEKEIETLNQLIAEYPNSAYIDDALFELGRSYLSTQNTSKAISSFNKIIEQYPNSSYVKKALLQLGLIYYNADKYDEALVNYKKVVAGFPGTPEAKNALTGIKNISVDKNDVDSYVKYISSIGGAVSVSVSEQDSLSYTVAENLYMTGDCDKSSESLKHYIENFPNGNFILNAQFYKAECNYRQEQYDEALVSYNFVIGKPKNTFTEQALTNACRINYNKGNYQAAIDDYTLLENVAELKNTLMEAHIGKMRCYYNLNDFNNTIEAANKVLSTEKISEEMVRESRFKVAKSMLGLNKPDSALVEFRKVAKEVKSTEGAESKFRIAEVYYNQGDYDKAEKEVFSFIEQNTPQQYWMAKAFILLSDVYVKKGDKFQANQTLHSIIDNYEIKTDGIIDLAKQKLETIGKMDLKNDTTKENDIQIQLK
jgi:TolA-binding protein